MGLRELLDQIPAARSIPDEGRIEAAAGVIAAEYILRCHANDDAGAGRMMTALELLAGEEIG